MTAYFSVAAGNGLLSLCLYYGLSTIVLIYTCILC